MKYAVLALALTACNPIKGKLKVTHTINGEIPPGTYDAEFDLSSRDSAVFRVQTNEGTREYYLRTPNNDHGPDYSGPISLPHDESGQPFDLSGNITTKVSNGAEQNAYESCTYITYQPQCGINGCHDQPVETPGRQYVEFHQHRTDTALSVQLSRSGAASFYGERHLSQKVYDRTDLCR